MSVSMLSSQHLGNTAFILYFEINNLDNQVDGQTVSIIFFGQTFDVHGLTQMKIFIRNTIDNKSEILLSVMKHQLTMVLKVEMNVICDDHKFEHNFTCTENWSPNLVIFKSSYTKKLAFNLQVYIKVSSSKSILDVMYADEDFTDFHLSAIDGSVAVHRACLSSHSDVFRRMLCGEWKEAAEGRVQIDGVTMQTLQHLKQYIYLGTLPANGLEPLLLIATYYLMEELKVECTIKLAYSVTSENLYDLLDFSFANDLPELTFAILKTLRAQPSDVIGTAHQKMMRPMRNNPNIAEKKEDICKEAAGDKSV